MLQCRRRLAAAVLGFVAASTASAAPPDWTATAAVASTDARVAALWVLDRADHRGRPFAIVDKKDARIYVFEPEGLLRGMSPVLLGLANGDRDAVPRMGPRSVASLSPAERTTPAGRFDSEPGINDKGEAIVWFDYDAALAIHRLRPAPAHERRAQRMESASAAEHRISFGCIVVPVAFYEQVIAPTLGSRRGVVYVLPEAESIDSMLRDVDLVSSSTPATADAVAMPAP
jgi:hypothetical protein